MSVAVDLSIGDVEEAALGGAFNRAGRRAALAGALPLLGVYFSSGYESTDYRGIAEVGATEEGDPALAGLRLRVAVASGRKLIAILESVRTARTFRYETVRAEQTGHLSGVLDLNRWLTRSRGGGDEVTYPVVEVARGVQTPENVLAAYAGQWIVRELQHAGAQSLAGDRTTDYTAARSITRRIERELQLAPFGSVADQARQLRTSSAVKQVIAAVRRRVRRREMAVPRPFADLADWVDRSLSGNPTLDAGDLDLAAYDDTFDPKLFELWCLRQLAARLSAVLNVPEPRVKPWLSGEPSFEFATFAGTVQVYFQTSVSRIDPARSARWRTADGAPLRGIPDIVVAAMPRGADSNRIVVIDPKLRQRDRAPAEELYKVLGYFENFEIHPPRGALLTYTTSAEAQRPVVFSDGEAGRLVWTALNPAADAAATDEAFGEVVETILDALGYEPPPYAAASTDFESTLAGVRSSLASWAATHSIEIAPSLERMRTLLGEDCWSALTEEERTMLATADTLGYQLDRTGDFSGPVIGLSAAVESVLHRSLIAPVFTVDELAKSKNYKTFGSQLWAVREACGDDASKEPRIREHIIARGFAVADLLAMTAQTGDLSTLNSRWRIPAAHRSVLTQDEWRASYKMVVGEGRLLARVITAVASVTV